MVLSTLDSSDRAVEVVSSNGNREVLKMNDDSTSNIISMHLVEMNYDSDTQILLHDGED